MSISSHELTGPASGRAAQPAQPAKTLSGKPPTAIHQGLTRTREQLANTVEALANKMDLPGRVKDRVQQTKDTVQAKAGEVRSLTNQALAKVSPPVAGRIDGLMERVRYRPVPTAAAVLGVLAVLRRLFCRNK